MAPPDAIYTDSENGTITGLAPAQIIYRAESMGNPVAIYGGSGGNTYTVQDTPLSSPPGLAGPGIKLNTGTGADVTNVLETAVMTLNIQGQAGLDTVNVGKFGSVQGVRGTVNVLNAASYTLLTVDDSLDTTPRNFVLDSFTPFMTGPEYGSITGLAPGVINYRALDVRDPVTILGGSGGNTITVNNTPSTNLGGGPTNTINLSSGAGVDTVTVKAVGPDTMLNIDGQGGIDGATIGSAQNILGVVNLLNFENVTSNFQPLGTRAGANTFSSTLIGANPDLDDLLAGVTHGERVA